MTNKYQPAHERIASSNSIPRDLLENTVQSNERKVTQPCHVDKSKMPVKQLQYYNMQQDLLLMQSYKEFQMVMPQIFIGGQISTLNLPKLQSNNISRILKVNGIAAQMKYDKHGINTKVMDIDDMPDVQIDQYFDEAHDYIHQGVVNGEGVLIVCTAGISRSAAIVISYLIRYQSMTYEQAYHKTKEARPFIQPNPGFTRILQSYGQRLKCDLCILKKTTVWLNQYGQKRLGQPLFKVIICDQCDGPMLVYIKDHKQELEMEELLQAVAICQKVGDDFYGQGRWAIEGKQKTIKDHFHWHIKEKKSYNYGQSDLIHKEPRLTTQYLNQVKVTDITSFINQQLTEEYFIIEKIEQKLSNNLPDLVDIEIHTRLEHQNLKVIEIEIFGLKQTNTTHKRQLLSRQIIRMVKQGNLIKVESAKL